MKKILYILSHPIQYQSPLLKKLAEQEDINLKVFYLANHTIGGLDKQFGVNIKWDTPLLDGYEYEFIKNHAPKPDVTSNFFGLINLNIISKIKKENADVVIVHGWAYLSNWIIFLFSFLFKSRIWIRGESPLNQELKKSKKTLFIKNIVFKHFLFKIIDKFLYIGKQNKDFYTYYGVDEKDLIFAPYAVNNDYFESEYKKYKDKTPELKKEFNIPNNNIVLISSGKYIEKKRPLDILEAFKRQQNDNISLILVGEGHLREQMEEKIKNENIRNVTLTGFVNQSQISKYYCVADTFILASTLGETWGLVVNEAMNFGLPIIVSDTPGSAYDLIIPNKNGFIFKTGDINELAKNIKYICENKEFRNSAKKYSLKRIKEYSYDIMIKNIIEELKPDN